MSAFTSSNLRDLVGIWSCAAFGLGLTAASISCFWLAVRRRRGTPDRETANVSAALAAFMLSVAFFIAFLGPALTAYSGPVPWEDRQVWKYDKYLAALIAVAFALVLAFDAFWLSRHGRRVLFVFRKLLAPRQ